MHAGIPTPYPPDQAAPPDQTPPPPPGPGRPPPDQTPPTPPGPGRPPGSDTTTHPWTRQTPPDQADPPNQADTPLGSRLQHTVYERPVRILLECILVDKYFTFHDKKVFQSLYKKCQTKFKKYRIPNFNVDEDGKVSS